VHETNHIQTTHSAHTQVTKIGSAWHKPHIHHTLTTHKSHIHTNNKTWKCMKQAIHAHSLIHAKPHTFPHTHKNIHTYANNTMLSRNKRCCVRALTSRQSQAPSACSHTLALGNKRQRLRVFAVGVVPACRLLPSNFSLPRPSRLSSGAWALGHATP
jgi:hypothetical protein